MGQRPAWIQSWGLRSFDSCVRCLAQFLTGKNASQSKLNYNHWPFLSTKSQMQPLLVFLFFWGVLFVFLDRIIRSTQNHKKFVPEILETNKMGNHHVCPGIKALAKWGIICGTLRDFNGLFHLWFKMLNLPTNVGNKVQLFPKINTRGKKEKREVMTAVFPLCPVSWENVSNRFKFLHHLRDFEK